jgi:hypothetical protein
MRVRERSDSERRSKEVIERRSDRERGVLRVRNPSMSALPLCLSVKLNKTD